MAKKEKPQETVRLLTLTEEQAQTVRVALAEQSSTHAAAKAAQARVTALLSMVAPPGANGFDVDTMTFLSEPQGPPLELKE